MEAHYGRYRVDRLIGEGAASKVFRAFDTKLSREVALKVLTTSAEPELRQRFLLEARAVAALKHPNIVALLDWGGEEAGALYLVMEYVPARSLYALTREHGLMSEATALCVGHEVALALEHAHAVGIVHRDIKPENLLLSQGRVVLTDFGGVKILGGPQASQGSSRTDVLGTPGFMAPEQFAGKGISPRTDLFSLGASLYNLMTGRIPYDGGSVNGTYRNLKSGRYIDPRTHRQLLTPDIAGLLARCLAPRPVDRFESAAAFREAAASLLRLHDVAEVRQELAAYERSPATHAVLQRERVVERLHQGLRDALRDHDAERAHGLVERIRALAPVDKRLEGVATRASRLVGGSLAATSWRRGFRVGLTVGAALGVGATVVLGLWLGS